MNYDWMTYEEIEKAVYPNLLAEIKESGYSICTISDFMGLGSCKEDDKTIWDKLTGKTKILTPEALGLAKYYNVKLEYLFADKLEIVRGKSQAYWRWYNHNVCKMKEIERQKAIESIRKELDNDPELLEFMKWCRTLTKEQRHELVLRLLQKDAIA